MKFWQLSVGDPFRLKFELDEMVKAGDETATFINRQFEVQVVFVNNDDEVEKIND